VLLSYPLGFTFVCPTELVAFSDRLAEFTAIGCKVAAISVDSKHTHLAWQNTPRSKGGLGKVAYPLIADVSKKICHDFGILIEDPADADCGVALRATIIMDPAGVIRAFAVNDLPVGRSVDEVLRLVKAFQYNAEHGEVCPAGWKPGDRAMVADPTKSKEYFSATFKA